MCENGPFSSRPAPHDIWSDRIWQVGVEREAAAKMVNLLMQFAVVGIMSTR